MNNPTEIEGNRTTEAVAAISATPKVETPQKQKSSASAQPRAAGNRGKRVTRKPAMAAGYPRLDIKASRSDADMTFLLQEWVMRNPNGVALAGPRARVMAAAAPFLNASFAYKAGIEITELVEKSGYTFENVILPIIPKAGGIL